MASFSGSKSEMVGWGLGVPRERCDDLEDLLVSRAISRIKFAWFWVLEVLMANVVFEGDEIVTTVIASHLRGT